MPTPDLSSPDAPVERRWVWRATLESRAAGKVSVLACAETVFAVALYWWIAIRWDTHWHLLSSVFIAPVLLLRSPESIALGVRWFMKDWLGFENYEQWSAKKRGWWLAGEMVFVGITSYALARWMIGHWLAGQTGWTLSGCSLLAGGLSAALPCSIVLAATFLVAVVHNDACGNAVPVTSMVGVMAAFAANGLQMFGVSILAATIGVLAALGLGFSLRGLVFRVAATLRYLHRGFGRLAENWQETNFEVDSCIPAEVIPGIREIDNSLAFDGFIRGKTGSQGLWDLFLRVVLLLLTACLFFPAFLYRLNIKATCWFWWPLAFLLKPVPPADEEGEQKQALCWPWDDPVQRLAIFIPALLVLGFLIYDYCDPAVWQQFRDSSAVPIPLKLVLGMQWGHIPPWHWALLTVAISGIGMFVIAGNACSHKRNGNWASYARSGLQKKLWLMSTLSRVRSIATIIMLLLGLGMCLISFPEWRAHLPDVLLHQLESFYHVHDLPAPVPAG